MFWHQGAYIARETLCPCDCASSHMDAHMAPDMAHSRVMFPAPLPAILLCYICCAPHEASSIFTALQLERMKALRICARAYSTVVAPDCIAPEVLAKTGYGLECWWSLGTIMMR